MFLFLFHNEVLVFRAMPLYQYVGFNIILVACLWSLTKDAITTTRKLIFYDTESKTVL